MAGAATNPDPGVRVRRLAGEVGAGAHAPSRWRETLLNTDLRRELKQLGRFLHLVVEHKYAIGFDGTILIEAKPHSRRSTGTTSTSIDLCARALEIAARVVASGKLASRIAEGLGPTPRSGTQERLENLLNTYL